LKENRLRDSDPLEHAPLEHLSDYGNGGHPKPAQNHPNFLEIAEPPTKVHGVPLAVPPPGADAMKWIPLGAVLTFFAAWSVPRESSMPSAARARYITPEIQTVPLARLTRNFSQSLNNSPLDTTILVNLARAYAMAWSLRSDSVPVNMRRYPGMEQDTLRLDSRRVWFGHQPSIAPNSFVVSTADSQRLRLASAHLDTALLLYDRALELAPRDLATRLGRAWLLTHTDDKARAISELRAIAQWEPQAAIDRPIQMPAEANRMLHVRAEAAGYLIQQLHPTRDSVEVGRLKEIIARYDRIGRMVTPIVIPLQDSLTATDIENRSARITFDADGTALPRQWSWIHPNAAWLVHDPLRTGRITSALQLFGSVTFWMFWPNGYEALCSLDDNADGELRGAELNGLALWHDRNQNGRSERGEVRTVQEHGVVALSCTHQRDAKHADRIMYSETGVQFKDGSTRPTFDLLLHERPSIVARAR
jgi:hypothetical protein